jgi:hypothetical protein
MVPMVLIQLEEEAMALYASTIIDLKDIISNTINIMILKDYISEWWSKMWESTFFKEFKAKDGICCSKLFAQRSSLEKLYIGISTIHYPI